MFEDFAVPVVTGTVETTGILLTSVVAERELGVTLGREERLLILRPGALGVGEPDLELDINGARYLLRGEAPVSHDRTEHWIVARRVDR